MKGSRRCSPSRVAVNTAADEFGGNKHERLAFFLGGGSSRYITDILDNADTESLVIRYFWRVHSALNRSACTKQYYLYEDSQVLAVTMAIVELGLRGGTQRWEDRV